MMMMMMMMLLVISHFLFPTKVLCLFWQKDWESFRVLGINWIWGLIACWNVFSKKLGSCALLVTSDNLFFFLCSHMFFNNLSLFMSIIVIFNISHKLVPQNFLSLEIDPKWKKHFSAKKERERERERERKKNWNPTIQLFLKNFCEFFIK